MKKLSIYLLAVLVIPQVSFSEFKSKENSLSRLSQAEFKRRLGVPESPDLDGRFENITLKSKMAAQDFDWRNRNGISFVGPVLNQAGCGSCVAFSTVANLETQVNITSGIPGLHPAFSTEALFACGGGACEFGWFPHLAAKHLQTVGVPDEACAPYTMGATGETTSCKSICSDSASRSTKILKYAQPSKGSKDIDAVKKALTQGPLVTTLMVFEDFVTYSSGVYKHSKGTSLGGHAVSIVGFEDSTRSWIIRNSWGEEWGEKGFAHISWDDTSGVGDNTWSYVVPGFDGYVYLKTPGVKAYVSDLTSIEAEATFPNLDGIDIKVQSQDGKVVWSESCNTKTCKADFNSRNVSDGRYIVTALARISGGKAIASQPEEMFVANSSSANLSILVESKTDITKPVSARIEFDLKLQMGSVPLNDLHIKVRDVSTLKEVYDKATQSTMSKMLFGWRTQTVPDGKYEFRFEGALIVNGKSTQSVVSQWTPITVDN